ncbi:MAG: hypothetical protein ACP5OG_02210 [Candidatus Nanoarchaeia archaeon]
MENFSESLGVILLAITIVFGAVATLFAIISLAIGIKTRLDKKAKIKAKNDSSGELVIFENVLAIEVETYYDSVSHSLLMSILVKNGEAILLFSHGYSYPELVCLLRHAIKENKLIKRISGFHCEDGRYELNYISILGIEFQMS